MRAIKTLSAIEMRNQGLNPFKRPLRFDMTIYLEPPKSWSKKKRQAALRGEIRATVKPDKDNVEKLVKDAITGVIIEDDAYFVEHGECSKLYAEKEGLIFKISELGGSCAYEKR